MSGRRVAQLARPDLGQVPSQSVHDLQALHAGRGRTTRKLFPPQWLYQTSTTTAVPWSTCTMIATINAVPSDLSFPLDYRSRTTAPGARLAR